MCSTLPGRHGNSAAVRVSTIGRSAGARRVSRIDKWCDGWYRSPRVRRSDMTARPAIPVAALAVTLALAGAGAAQDARRASPLRVGAAKVDVTPTDSELPKNYLGVLDRLYAR